MSKTVEQQIEKSSNLVEGLRKHVKETQAHGIAMGDIERMEQTVRALTAANEEVDRLREELQPKVKHMNELLDQVKAAYAEYKRTLKGYYPQERWAEYGVPDKR